MTTRQALRLPVLLKRAFVSALGHDCLNLAQSAAYSAMVALFPALVVAGAAIALLPGATPLRDEVGAFFDQVLPADVFPLLTSYFSANPKSPHTSRAIALAAVVSIIGASSVIATLMEGLRRASNLPADGQSFLARRGRALALVPLSLVPLLIATVLIVFGDIITSAFTADLAQSVKPAFAAISTAARWTVALAGVVGVTALIFHMGVPRVQRWTRVLPGALVATATWFVTTLIFGWYVTRFANYSQVYGSLGAGIALLFWLYIVFLSLLVGAEFNAQYHKHHAAPEQPSHP